MHQHHHDVLDMHTQHASAGASASGPHPDICLVTYEDVSQTTKAAHACISAALHARSQWPRKVKTRFCMHAQRKRTLAIEACSPHAPFAHRRFLEQLLPYPPQSIAAGIAPQAAAWSGWSGAYLWLAARFFLGPTQALRSQRSSFPLAPAARTQMLVYRPHTDCSSGLLTHLLMATCQTQEGACQLGLPVDVDEKTTLM